VANPDPPRKRALPTLNSYVVVALPPPDLVVDAVDEVPHVVLA
jgi:hypothetical protein